MKFLLFLLAVPFSLIAMLDENASSSTREEELEIAHHAYTHSQQEALEVLKKQKLNFEPLAYEALHTALVQALNRNPFPLPQPQSNNAE